MLLFLLMETSGPRQGDMFLPCPNGKRHQGRPGCAGEIMSLWRLRKLFVSLLGELELVASLLRAMTSSMLVTRRSVGSS